MKFLIVFILSFSANTWGTELRFSCKNKISNLDFGMNVFETNNVLKAYLTGTGLIGPQDVDVLKVSKAEAMNVTGITQIISKIKMTKIQWSKVETVEIFTTGNFEDDLAGVRGVNFLNLDDNVIKKGMFFGWAGPSKCLN